MEAGSKPDGGFAPLERRLYQSLQLDASTHIDALIEQLAEHSASEIIAALCNLELAGHVRQLPGKNFVRVW